MHQDNSGCSSHSLCLFFFHLPEWKEGNSVNWSTGLTLFDNWIVSPPKAEVCNLHLYLLCTANSLKAIYSSWQSKSLASHPGLQSTKGFPLARRLTDFERSITLSLSIDAKNCSAYLDGKTQYRIHSWFLYTTCLSICQSIYQSMLGLAHRHTHSHTHSPGCRFSRVIQSQALCEAVCHSTLSLFQITVSVI